MGFCFTGDITGGVLFDDIGKSYGHSKFGNVLI